MMTRAGVQYGHFKDIIIIPLKYYNNIGYAVT